MICGQDGYTKHPKAILDVQTGILVLFLFTVITFNMVAIYITVKTLRKCVISKLFGSSYLGNIMAACSLFGGDLYTLFKWGALYNCTATLDKHFFLYLGITINMTVLAVNTYLRTSNIRSISRRQLSRGPNFWSLKMPAMLWGFSIISALGGIFLEMSLESNFTEVTLGLVTPFFVTVLVLNIQLSLFLHKQKKHAASLSAQPTTSYANIHSAENVVCRIVKFQVSSYIVWIVVISLIKSFKRERSFYVIFIWLSRVSYLLSFCCECFVMIVTRWVKCRKCLVAALDCSTIGKKKRDQSLELNELSQSGIQEPSTANLELTELSTETNSHTV